MTADEANVLAASLSGRFNASVETQSVDGRGRYRFAVVSPQFHEMRHLHRQDAIWELVDATLRREAMLDITLILAFAPGELAETGDPS